MEIEDFAWKYLDRPRADRLVAFADAKAQGHASNADYLADLLGIDVHTFVQMYRHLPQGERRAAALADAQRLGLPFARGAITTSLRQDPGWF